MIPRGELIGRSPWRWGMAAVSLGVALVGAELALDPDAAAFAVAAGVYCVVVGLFFLAKSVLSGIRLHDGQILNYSYATLRLRPDVMPLSAYEAVSVLVLREAVASPCAPVLLPRDPAFQPAYLSGAAGWRLRRGSGANGGVATEIASRTGLRFVPPEEWTSEEVRGRADGLGFPILLKVAALPALAFMLYAVTFEEIGVFARAGNGLAAVAVVLGFAADDRARATGRDSRAVNRIMTASKWALALTAACWLIALLQEYL